MTGLLFAVLFGALMAGCATEPPAAPPPAAPAVELPATVEAIPLRMAPRKTWRRIPIDKRGGYSAAFAASPELREADGTLRLWIVLDLKQPIPLPETGGHARSVAFLADYRCETREWAPIEGTWYLKAGAEGPEVQDKPRQAGFRVVQPGTLVDVFLQAACRLR